MHKLITLACALALGATWSLGTAYAADEVKDKTVETKDTVKDKAVEAKDKIKEKAVDAKEAIKDTAHRAKEKMKASTERANDRMAMTDTRAAQEALKTQGIDPGPIDGRMGPRTRAAISDYQRRENLPVTGQLDDATMAKLNVRSSRADVPAASPTTSPDPKKQNP
jgi:peptidoglycan hydrolase-like protein with peptidoglycan-binding domain